MTSGTLVIWLLFYSDNSTCMPCLDGSVKVGVAVLTVSSMRYWKRLIKLVNDIDCYYYMIIYNSSYA